jgi:hypothetical protein
MTRPLVRSNASGKMSAIAPQNPIMKAASARDPSNIGSPAEFNNVATASNDNYQSLTGSRNQIKGSDPSLPVVQDVVPISAQDSLTPSIISATKANLKKSAERKANLNAFKSLSKANQYSNSSNDVAAFLPPTSNGQGISTPSSVTGKSLSSKKNTTPLRTSPSQYSDPSNIVPNILDNSK